MQLLMILNAVSLQKKIPRQSIYFFFSIASISVKYLIKNLWIGVCTLLWQSKSKVFSDKGNWYLITAFYYSQVTILNILCCCITVYMILDKSNTVLLTYMFKYLCFTRVRIVDCIIDNMIYSEYFLTNKIETSFY